jgi:P pilus assembly chaperone PapD
MTVSRLRRLTLAGAALIASMSAMPSHAQGDLLIAPTRVIISQGGSSEVILSNIGTEPATYRISAELRRMTEDGDFQEVSEAEATPAEKAALQMITFAPRRITLLPGQPQSVRISIRPPEGIADGEDRVHLNFRAIPPALKPEASTGPATGVSIKLTPVYGITIPVFVRRGRLEGGATLSGSHLVKDQGGSFVELDLARTGQRSVYGEFIGKSARGDVLFEMRGVAAYPEITHRKVHIPLSAEQLAKLKGPIKIEYRELPENGGALIAETSATFP